MLLSTPDLNFFNFFQANIFIWYTDGQNPTENPTDFFRCFQKYTLVPCPTTKKSICQRYILKNVVFQRKFFKNVLLKTIVSVDILKSLLSVGSSGPISPGLSLPLLAIQKGSQLMGALWKRIYTYYVRLSFCYNLHIFSKKFSFFFFWVYKKIWERIKPQF